MSEAAKELARSIAKRYSSIEQKRWWINEQIEQFEREVRLDEARLRPHEGTCAKRIHGNEDCDCVRGKRIAELERVANPVKVGYRDNEHEEKGAR